MSMMVRFSKWTAGAFSLALALMLIAANCMSFSLKQEQIDEIFSEAAVSYQSAIHHQGERPIHYVSTGDPDKPMVLFVHGSPGSWDAFVSYLANAELLERAHLVSVDRPGFGQSGRGKPERSLAQQAADIAPIMATNRSGKPAILVGHSFGGPVIARMAMDYPHLVGGLVLVAASVDPQLEKTKWFQYPADWLIFAWMVPRDLLVTNREILPLKGELEEMLPLWPSITQPTVIIQGGQDGLVPPDNASFAQRMLVNAPTTMLVKADMNHFVPWTHPELVHAAIIQQLNELEKAAAIK